MGRVIQLRNIVSLNEEQQEEKHSELVSGTIILFKLDISGEYANRSRPYFPT